MEKHHLEKYVPIIRHGLPFRAVAAGVSLMLACTPYMTALASASASHTPAVANVQQTNFNVVGTVIDNDGMPLPGVTVIVKGTSSGSITDTEGKYIIDVPSENEVLEFSCYGYQTMNLMVGNQRIINVIMKDEILKMNEVVVGALGLKKKDRSLSYVNQALEGDELVIAKDMNLMNSLTGKVAGMKITQSASGLGGSVKVQIRGMRSASGLNQPLYVIDGIPMNSVSREVTSTTLGGLRDAANRDGGDGISNLNPDDIESINVLKGAVSAALYGSSAANGVVVITTKEGKIGRPRVTFSTTTTWDKPTYGIPEFQNSYGGTTSSWGSEISGSENYADKFFKTGVTTINSLSLSSGSESMRTYFSYANAYGKGILDRTSLNKHNLNLRETAFFFENKLRVDAHVNLIYQNVKNRPTPGGFYMNPLIGVYKFPRGGVQGGESFDYYREQYKVVDPVRNIYTQNWYTTPNSFEQNPYWLINRVSNDEKRVRTLASLNLSYQFNEYLSLQARGHGDFIADAYEAKMYAGTDPALVGKNGRFMSDESNQLSTYGDLIFAYNQDFRLVSVQTAVGASIRDVIGKNLGFDSTSHMYHPNIFSVGNIDHSNSTPFLDKYHAQEQSVFIAGQLGIKDWLFFDVTARNDWTSSLAATKYQNKGIFYPSAGMAFILSDVIDMPDWISMGKIRAAWSKVGNAIPAYLSHPLNTCGNSGVIDFNTTAPFEGLKPEMTSSIEVGTEWRLFNNHIDLDVTYYRTHTRNQLFTLPAPAGSKYTWYYVNAGDIQNEGVGVMLGANPFTSKDFNWRTTVNFSFNKNKVIRLVDGLNHFNLSPIATSNSYAMRLEEGGSYGDIYGRKFLRDEKGYLQRDASGMPIPDRSDLKKIGNCSPDFLLSCQNTFHYKDFSLSFLVDGSFGGDVVSLTQAELDKYGVSKVTGDARLHGGVNFGGVKIPNPEQFYNLVGGRDGITEYYVYDATNIRLRELAIGYSLPSKVLIRQSFIKGLDVSLVGRNLFFLMNNAPYDPDATLSVGNDLQGVDVFGMPTTRSLGFNIKLKF